MDISIKEKTVLFDIRLTNVFEGRAGENMKKMKLENGKDGEGEEGRNREHGKENGWEKRRWGKRD